MKQLGFIAFIFLVACKHEPEQQVYGDYPAEIGEIMLTKCAVSGCHNDASREAAAGLSLASWDRLFEGSSQNAAVVPYRADQSILMYFINTFSDLGPAISPTMPFNSEALSKHDVIKIRDWINKGAPDKNGDIKFSDNPDRQKYYVLNGKCKMVAVFDAATDRVMRYINISGNANDFVESIRVTPDGKYWCVLLTTGKLLKYNATTDTYSGELILGNGLWRGLEITNSGNAIVCNYTGKSNYSGGELVEVDVNAWQIIHRFNAVNDSIYFPQHCLSFSNHYYATCNQGNFIYKINAEDVTKIKLNPMDELKFNDNTYRPGAIVYSSLHHKYMVACTRSNEVRVFNADTDELEKVIQVGNFPNEMLITDNLLWVTCTEDIESFPGNKGAVFAIDLNTMQVLKKLDVGYQPKGLTYNPFKQVILIANRNADPVGADKPHHYSGCEGNNGYITAIDVNQLEVIKGFKAEVSVDPYSISFRN